MNNEPNRKYIFYKDKLDYKTKQCEKGR